MKPISPKVRQYILTLIWIIVLTHFLKDITQDILKIPTFLDTFGNIQEDVSWLPIWTQHLIFGAGISSFLAEIFLLISIPIVKNRKKKSSLEKWVVGAIIFMFVYFPIVFLLDPRLKVSF
jgi:hypothetical protein